MIKVKRLSLLLVSFMLFGCNNSNVNSTKSPFNDSYTPIGMNGEYKITDSFKSTDYKDLKTAINSYNDNIENKFIISSYTRTEESRDLKAAYFGRNLGAANLCRLTHKVDINTRYKNNVTTKFSTSHIENQTVSGGITKSNPVLNDYIYVTNDSTTGSQPYQQNRQSWNDNEEKKTDIVKQGENVNLNDFDDTTNILGLKGYTDDIKSNFGTIVKREKKIVFNVLDDINNAVYGKSGDKYLIKEAVSLYNPYSTAVGDTYKAVDNFFYEALLEKEGDHFRFTNFRFYTELLILSEAFSDETKIPVVYLEKPQRVEYQEIKYIINYKSNTSELDTFNKGNIPQPK